MEDGTSSRGGGQTKNMTYTEKCHDILQLVHTGIFGQVTFCGVHPNPIDESNTNSSDFTWLMTLGNDRIFKTTNISITLECTLHHRS